MYKHTDYFKKYGRIMQFNKNKKEPFHRWYPFVEGYSKEFIQSIVKEMDRNNLVCLEPFSGSGTTALEAGLFKSKACHSGGHRLEGTGFAASDVFAHSGFYLFQRFAHDFQ